MSEADLSKSDRPGVDDSFASPSGWQPIETAPRDGTDFLALCTYQRRHHQMVGCFARDGKFRSWPGRHIYYPAEWQPLPVIAKGL